MKFKSPQEESFYIWREQQLGRQNIATGSVYNQSTLPIYKPSPPVSCQSRVSPPSAPTYYPVSSDYRSRERNFAVPGIKKPLSGFQKGLRSFFAALGLLFILAIFYEGYGHDRFIQGATSVGVIGLVGALLFFAVRQILRVLDRFFLTKVGRFTLKAGIIIFFSWFLYEQFS